MLTLLNKLFVVRVLFVVVKMSNIPYKQSSRTSGSSQAGSSRTSAPSRGRTSKTTVNVFAGKKIREVPIGVVQKQDPTVPHIDDRRELTKIVYQKIVDSIPTVTPTGTTLKYVSRKELEDPEGQFPEIVNPNVLIPFGIDNVKLTQTLYDPLMGPYDRSKRCQTCDAYGTDCPYHPGKILFKRPNSKGELIGCPIYRISFLVELARCLNCICQTCGRLRIPPNIAEERGIMQYSGKERLAEYAKESVKVKICQREDKSCVVPGIYKHEKKELIVRVSSSDPTKKENIFPYQAYQILHFLPDDEIKALGFTSVRPEDIYIVWGVLVIPPLVRPVRTLQGDKAVIDDFTERYAAILKASNELRNLAYDRGKQIEEVYKKAKQTKNYTGELDRHPFVEKYFFDHTKALMEQVNGLVNDEASSGVNPGKKSFGTLVRGKEGYVRKHLTAAVISHSARTVIGPGYNLHVWEIAVPAVLASNLTTRVLVNDINMKECDKLLEEGKVKYVVRANIPTKIASNNRSGPSKFQLQVGDEVFRQLRDGDQILCNRNPTLHKQSIISFRVRIVPDRLSLALHLTATAGLNADFDGDEMNVYVPQTIEALAELQLMTVEASLESLSRGGPIIGLVYNALPGLYKLTGPNAVLSKEVFSDITMFLYIADTERGKDSYKTTAMFHPTESISPYLFIMPKPENFATKKEFIAARRTNYFWRCRKNNVNPYHGRSIIGLFLPHDFNYSEKYSSPQLYYMGKYEFESETLFDETGNPISEEIYRISDDGRVKIDQKLYKIDKVTEPVVRREDENVIVKYFVAVQYEKQYGFVVRDGILVSGSLSKQNVGVGSSVRFLTFVYRYLGSIRGVAFLNHMNMLGNYYLSIDPLTTSLMDFYDYTDGGKLRQKVTQLIESAKEKILPNVEEIKDDPISEQHRQETITTILGNVGFAGLSELQKPSGIYPGSDFAVGVESGAKGNKPNLIQSAISLGLMKILGSPMPKTLVGSKSKRITPYTTHGSQNLANLGYIQSCLAGGLTPAEQTISQMNARVDVAQGKLGVPETGYIQRRLVQLMAELVVETDGTIRNGKVPGAKIIQYRYGDVGFGVSTVYHHRDDEGDFYTPWNIEQFLNNM